MKLSVSRKLFVRLITDGKSFIKIKKSMKLTTDYWGVLLMQFIGVDNADLIITV